MKLPSSTFCVLPFGHFFLNEEGKSFACCYSVESGECNRDENEKEIFVTNSESQQRAWNSPTQRKMRREMLAGEAPSPCVRCFQLESHGLQSLREVVNLDFGAQIPKIMETVKADGVMPDSFFSVDLRLGNQCNLRCQMCSPVSSRGLVADFKLLYPNADSEADRFENVTWFKSDELMESIFKNSADLRELHFAGGEPFLIPEVTKIISRLADSPRAAQCRLSFNTNGTVLPKELFRLFPKFKGVRIIVSLDGLNEVNDYIRFPSKFASIRRNLETLARDFQDFNLETVCFNTTVQVHNIFHLPELIKNISRISPNFLPFAVLGPLNYPECLSIQVLPRELKEKARQMLEDLIGEERAYWLTVQDRQGPGAAMEFEKNIRGLLEFMFDADKSNLLPELRRFSGVMEGIRGRPLPIPHLEPGPANG